MCPSLRAHLYTPADWFNRRNQCSLNTSMQFLRHVPLFLKGALEANVKWQAAVAQLRTSQTKLPHKGTGSRWLCVVLTPCCL